MYSKIKEFRGDIAWWCIIFAYISFWIAIISAFISIFILTPLFLAVTFILILLSNILPDKKYEQWKWERDYLNKK